MGNLVAIVGRPNVGKSTLFNRLTETKQAIISDEAGTTRDRQYGKCLWGSKEFSVVDTGGWVVNSDDVFEGEIRKQVTMAMEEADVILFVVDVQNGLTDLDTEMASMLPSTASAMMDTPRLRYGMPRRPTMMSECLWSTAWSSGEAFLSSTMMPTMPICFSSMVNLLGIAKNIAPV